MFCSCAPTFPTVRNFQYKLLHFQQKTMIREPTTRSSLFIEPIFVEQHFIRLCESIMCLVIWVCDLYRIIYGVLAFLCFKFLLRNVKMVEICNGNCHTITPKSANGVLEKFMAWGFKFINIQIFEEFLGLFKWKLKL